METCPTDADLSAYLTNRLDDPGAHAVAAHLAECAKCVSRLRALEDEADRLRLRRAPSLPPEQMARRLALLPAGRAVSADQAPRIDGYEILSELGRGGMGVVYKARHARFGVVALKIIRDGDLAGLEEVARFLAEAKAAKAMSDQAEAEAGRRLAVARVHEIGECRGFHFIGMEWAVGGTVEKHIQAFRANPRETARVMATVAEAVNAMHQAPIIHRDLKPENILLQLRLGAATPEHGPPLLSSLDPLVSDYGLAKRLGQINDTQSMDLRGTPAHLAPEQVNRSHFADQRTDIYSLGVTLYRMLTGTAPFAGASRHELLHRIQVGYPSWPSGRASGVPRELECICLKCLERDPKRRYANAGDLADDLRRFLSADPANPVRARLPGRARRAARWCRKRPTAVALFGFLTLTAFALATLAMALWFRAEAAVKTAAVANAQAHLDNERAERAEEGTRQAEDVARVQRQAAHDSVAHAAQTAVRRGDWTTAMADYQRTIDDHLSDERRLRVERLFGFFAVNDEATLRVELDALERQNDLGPLTAQVSLIRGAYLLCDGGRQEEGRAAIRRALAARADLFSEADALYAEALAETRPLPMIKALRRAVAADVFHYSAHATLVLALLASGQPDTAVAQADEMAGLFPDSPIQPYVRAIVRLLYGDRKTMDEELDRMAVRMKSDLTPLRRYFHDFAAVLDILAEAQNGLDNLDFLTWVRLLYGLAQMETEVATSAKLLAFPIPSSCLLFSWFGDMFAAVRDTPAAGDVVSPQLLQLGRDYPDALIQYLIMAKRLAAAYKHLAANRLVDARLAFAEASSQAYATAYAPTLLVRSPLRYQARFVGMIADVGLLKLNPGDETERLRRIWDNLHRLAADGRAWPACRRQEMAMFLQMLTSAATPELAADWKADAPAGAEALRQRNLQFDQIGGALLAEWEIEEPNNPTIDAWRRALQVWSEGNAKLPPPSGPAPGGP